MKFLVFTLGNAESLARKLCRVLPAEKGRLKLRHFPDGESYLRVLSKCRSRHILLVADFAAPNVKTLELFFLAEALRAGGAKSVGLVAPYLPYMRQDKAFHPGEAITSRSFAKLISKHFDWLLTVDPHLHRYHALKEIYSIPTQVTAAAPSIAQWIKKNTKHPLLIGPDAESKQWVSQIAAIAGSPFVVLQKKRHGDKKVSVSSLNLRDLQGHTPVLIDDIISTGHTMIEVVHQLRRSRLHPICIGVHALFAGKAYADLRKAGAAKILTCNTLSHPSNRIDLSTALAKDILGFARKAIL